MKGDKAVVLTINLLLAAALSAAVLVFAEQIHASGWPWFSRVLACWPTLLCFIAGAAVRKGGSKGRVPACIGAVIVSAAIMYFTFPARDLGHCLYMALAALLGIYLYCIGLRGDEPYPPRMAIITVAVMIVECIWFSRADREVALDISALAGVTLAAFLLSMFSFNAAGLSSGLHNTGSGQKMKLPAGIRGKNMIMLALFLAVGVLISFFKPLKSLFSFIVRIVLIVVGWISEMNSEDTPQMPAGPTPTPTASDQISALPDVPVSKPLMITFYILMAVIFIIAIIIIVALVFGGNQKLRRGRGAGGRKRRSRRRAGSEEAEFDESVERLLDLRGFVRSRREKMAERLKKLMRRPQRIEDMPDGRTKVRFAYYSLLRSGAGKGLSRSLTPLEVSSRQRAGELAGLAMSYSAVRYDEDSEPDSGETANAVRAMTVMRRRG